jgi:cytochrome c-type biogenesis protein CcmH/NrfG
LVRASKQLPANAEVWATLGDAYQQLSRYKEARDAYRQALRFDPKNDLVRNGYGNALVRSGDPAAGLKEFRSILEHDPATSTCR